MKLNGIFFLFLFFMTGCMSDDLSSCPPLANVRLHLTYTGDTGRLADYLSSADLYLFDEQERLVSVYGIDSQELEEEVLSLWLEPGGYRVVCWGNTAPPSVPQTGITMDEALLRHAAPQTSAAFYAPAQPGPEIAGEYRSFTLSVPAKGSVEETIAFMPSHREITLSVTGYRGSGHDAEKPLALEIAGVPAVYNFRLMSGSDRAGYILQTGYPDLENRAVATLYTPFFLIEEEDIPFTIRQQDGTPVVEDTINRILAVKGVDPGYTGPIRIDFGFFAGGIDITVPGWNTNPIDK